MNWLVKEEPSNYDVAQFQQDGRTVWSGVKHPVAQKHLRRLSTPALPTSRSTPWS